MRDTEAGAFFGQIAVSKKYVTREQLLEALDEQTRLRTEGEHIELGQILLRNGWLTTEQFLEILSLQDRGIFRCPKCGRGFNVIGLKRERTYKCVSCDTELEPPATAHDLRTSLENPIAVTAETAGPLPTVRFKIGRYRLVREHARGGMAIVFEAHDPTLNRRVALKVILETPRTREFVKRLYREAEIAANLHHPNIVNIYEVGVEPPSHYIAMEFVNGPTLQQRLTTAPLPIREAVAMVADVAGAVHFAHTHGIIHRDLKPANIMFDETGRVLVTDFGLARAQGQSVRLTQRRALIGTPHYMSPEQARGEVDRINALSDVFSLGVILYESISGRHPFEGASPVEVCHTIITEPPQPLGNVDSSLAALCRRALAKDMGARHPTAQALSDELRAWLADKSTPTPSVPSPAPKSRRVLWISIFMMAIIAALSMVVFLRPDPTQRTASEALAYARAARERGDVEATVTHYLKALRHHPHLATARIELVDFAKQQKLVAEREHRDAGYWRMLITVYDD